MLNIRLNNMQFYAFHGLYEEEKVKGGTFVVNLEIGYKPTTDIIQHIHETIDYVKVFELIEQQMLVATELLETWVMKTTQLLQIRFGQIQRIQIELVKVQPPIHNFTGTTSANYEWCRKG